MALNGIAGPTSSLLLATAVGLFWVGVVGMLRAGDAFARLHLPGAAVLVAAPTVAAALSLTEGLSPTTIRAWLIAVVLVASNGVLTHATARAEWLRHHFGSGRTDEEEGPTHGDP